MTPTPTSPLFLTPLIVVLFLVPLTTFAQDGSVESQSKVPPAPVPIEETITTPADAVIMAPREPDTGIFMEATTTSQEVVPTPVPIPTPTPPASPNPTPVATSTGVQNIDTTESADTNYILWLALAALAILPLGYVAAQSLKKKNPNSKEQEKDSNRCLNLKEMLEFLLTLYYS